MQHCSMHMSFRKRCEMNFVMKNLLAGLGAVSVALAGWSGCAAAQPKPTSIAGQVLACRAIARPDERLACFDRESAVLRDALSSHEVVMLDAKDVQRSRREMFGLSDPDQKILGRSVKQTQSAFAPVDGVVRSTTSVGYGHYLMVLEGGAVWRNIDLLDAAPPSGSKIHIEKTAFGGYLIKMPNFQSVHAVRLR